MHLSFSKLALFASVPLAAGKNVVRRAKAKADKPKPAPYDTADRKCLFRLPRFNVQMRS